MSVSHHRTTRNLKCNETRRVCTHRGKNRIGGMGMVGLSEPQEALDYRAPAGGW
jgi:hypothetical protein